MDSYSPSKDITFYYVTQSTSSLTEAILNELDLTVDRVKLEIGTGPGKTQDKHFLDVNPNGRVPTIVHEGTVIWEAAAVTMYLGELFGVEKGLWPQLGPKRGEAMKWVSWASVSLHTAGNRIAELLPEGHPGSVEEGSFDWINPKDRTADKMLHARERMDKLLMVLNRGLEGREYLVGEYTFADTHVSLLIGWFGMMEVKLDAFPNIVSWSERCRRRPAIQKMFE